MMKIFLFIFAAIVSTESAALVGSTPTISTQCEWGGHFFDKGTQYKPNDCTMCQCDNGGRAACAVVDCFFTPCVDSVHVKGNCCNTCPNGNNCYALGQIIPAGKEVKINDSTFCKCPSPWARPQQAVCRVVETIQPITVDNKL